MGRAVSCWPLAAEGHIHLGLVYVPCGIFDG